MLYFTSSGFLIAPVPIAPEIETVDFSVIEPDPYLVYMIIPFAFSWLQRKPRVISVPDDV